MVQVTGAFDTYQAIGNREQLADAIYMITPEDTPLMTLIGREGIEGTHPEWQTDKLAAPSANAQIEGDTWVFAAFLPTARVGNYTQISDKKIVVTRTQDKVIKAGRKSELKRELKKQGTVLKKDMEYAILSPKASVAGNSATPRQLAGFPSWCTTNVSRGATGANGGFQSGTGLVTAPTPGTKRAWTLVMLDDTLQSVYTNGGNVTTVMCSPYNKRLFSGFTGIAQMRANQPMGQKDQLTIFAGADSYVSDWGTLNVVPNRVMATDATVASNVLVIDPTMANVGIFDDIQMYEAAKVGDAERRVLVVEYSYVCRNEAGMGVVADVFGLTAST
jgi:Family of unknown function (DUF5309)